MDQPVLATNGLTKAYGPVEALRQVDFRIRPAEVVGLVGDNGAGKSTLVGCLSGSITPSRGTILFDGEEVAFASPRDAQALGVQTVYQDLSLAMDLTPVQNVFLGREPLRPGLLGRLGLLDRRAMAQGAADELRQLAVHPRAFGVPTRSLSGGQRQAVALARALNWGKRVILLDEPTAALGVLQTRMVLDMVRSLPARGIPVVLVSHSLSDVFAVTTRIVVLRLGEIVLDVPTADTDPDMVVAAITGARLTGRTP